MTIDLVPSPPDWRVRWQELDARYAWVRALRGCRQDPAHHAEGDVWIHTRMVLEALVALPAYRTLDEAARARVFWGALLHDVGKPATTREEDGRITSRGHSSRGARLARRILWELGLPVADREAICAMVGAHQIPFFLVERPDARRIALVASQSQRLAELCLLTEADGRGRECADRARIVDAVELARLFCTDEGVLDGPYPFPSSSARLAYAAGEQANPAYAPHDAFTCEVTVLSGLPGAGKDTWARRHAAGLPMVSLDDLRVVMDVDPEDPQDAVVKAGREAMRAHLRARQSFVYNATNLSRAIRGPSVQLARDYGARVRIVYVEAPRERLFAQNRARSHPVPDAVIERLLGRWETPAVTEAHEVVYAVGEG